MTNIICPKCSCDNITECYIAEHPMHYVCQDCKHKWQPEVIKTASAEHIANITLKLMEASKDLLATIEAYELEDEIDAGEDEDGAVKVLRRVLQEMGAL